MSSSATAVSQCCIGIAFNRGDLWFIVALLIYGFYTAMLRKRPPMHPLSFLAVGMGWVRSCCFRRSWWRSPPGTTTILDREALASFAYVCIFPSLLGYLFLNRGIELIGANRAAPFMHLFPVFGSVMAIVLLGEQFELYHAIGYGARVRRDYGRDTRKA